MHSQYQPSLTGPDIEVKKEEEFHNDETFVKVECEMEQEQEQQQDGDEEMDSGKFGGLTAQEKRTLKKLKNKQRGGKYRTWHSLKAQASRKGRSA